MTTINNLTIEQMREIVDGAPEGATHIGNRYTKLDGANIYAWIGQEWVKQDLKLVTARWLASHEVKLSDLRTAIAKHEPKMHSHLTSNALQGDDIAKHDSREFKVGDWVLTIDPWFGKTLLKITGFAMVAEKTALFECGGFFRVSALRHATPAEIKAGHRIDDTTDHVTDIRNHVSPNTRVVDL